MCERGTFINILHFTLSAFSSQKLWGLRLLPSKYNEKFWGKPQILVGIGFTSEIGGNLRLLFGLSCGYSEEEKFWVFFWWCGNSGIGINLGSLEVLKKYFSSSSNCLPIYLWTVLLFEFQSSMPKCHVKSCVRSPNLEPQINPHAPFWFVLLAKSSMLCRCCCFYFNLSLMNTLGTGSDILG